MIQIDLRFLAGRFHATPWGRHVNEGEAEWPPSPWRLLRALVASWKTTAADVPDEKVQALLAKLATPPNFKLPDAALSHTRHYMPQGGTATLLVHDAFVAVDRSDSPESTLSFLWPDQSLDSEQQALLDRLLLGIGYFGRAESWCEASRGSGIVGKANAVPSKSELKVPEAETTNLLCPEESITLAELMVETSELQKKGYNRPPGSRWVSYRRPRTALSGTAGSPSKRQPPAKHIAVFLLQARVLPKKSETLLVADWARLGINGAYGRRHGGEASANFTGKLQGEMRRDQHQHVFFLPDSVERWHDRLDRLYVWSPKGFTPQELEVIKSIRTFPDLRRQSRERHREGTEGRESQEAERFHLVPLALLEDTDRETVFGLSRVWVSSTPYLCARHPKRDDKDSPQQQIKRECEQRGMPEVEVTDYNPQGTNWLEYKRRRWRKDMPPGSPQGFRLEFAEPVLGPLSLGANSHFGMGRFVPGQS